MGKLTYLTHILQNDIRLERESNKKYQCKMKRIRQYASYEILFTFFCISEDFCQNNTDSLKLFPHPTNCKSFIQCDKSITYSFPCQKGDFCFGLESKIGCDECDMVTCQSTGLYTFNL